MMKHIFAGALALSSCGTPLHALHTQLPKPDCPKNKVILLQHLGDPTNCDMHKPQLLAAIIPNNRQAFQDCRHRGGQLMQDLTRFYCIGLDY